MGGLGSNVFGGPQITSWGAYNDLGQQIGGGSNPTPFSNASNIWGAAQNLGSADMANRIASLMTSGGAPRTGGEAAALQAAYERQAAGMDNSAYSNGIAALMRGTTYGPGGNSGNLGGGNYWGGAAGTADPQTQAAIAYNNSIGYGGGGGESSGNVAGGYAENKPLADDFRNQLMDLIKNPGMSADQIQGMKNVSNDQIAESQKNAEMNAANLAEATGFGQSGARLQGLQQSGAQYAGMKNASGRDVDQFATQNRQQQLQQGLNTAGGYLSHVEDMQAQNARFQQQLAAEQQARQEGYNHEDRMQAIMASMNHHTAVPNYSGLISQAGKSPMAGMMNFGYGGGANSGYGVSNPADTSARFPRGYIGVSAKSGGGGGGYGDGGGDGGGDEFGAGARGLGGGFPDPAIDLGDAGAPGMDRTGTGSQGSGFGTDGLPGYKAWFNSYYGK